MTPAERTKSSWGVEPGNEAYPFARSLLTYPFGEYSGVKEAALEVVSISEAHGERELVAGEPHVQRRGGSGDVDGPETRYIR